MSTYLIRGTVALLVLAAPVRLLAFPVEATGSFEFNDGSGTGTWAATTDLDNSAFNGQVTLTSGDTAVPAEPLPLTGSLIEDRIVFATSGSADGPHITFESDPIRGAALTGTCHLGEKSGHWTATLSVIRGVPAAPLPMADDNVNVSRPIIASRCDILKDPVAYRSMSSLGYQQLVRACRREQPDDSSSDDTIFSYLRNKLWAVRATLLGYSRPRPAFAQLPNRLVNDPTLDSWHRVTQSEPTLAISPINRDIILAAYNDSATPLSNVGWSRSVDRGTTWTDKGAVIAGSGVSDGDPVLGVDAAGRFFLATIFDPTGPPIETEIAVYRSTDNGLSWSAPTIASVGTDHCQGGLECADKPDLAVDPTTGYIYSCWGEAGIRFARSTDGGASFTELAAPISDLAAPEAEHEQNGCAIAIGDDGNVYVAWYENVLQQIHFKRSTDYGASFPGSDIRVAFAVGFPPYAPNCCGQYELNGGIRYSNCPTIAVDPLNRSRVFVAWNQYTLGSTEIAFSRSNDLGSTWSAPVRVNSTSTSDQFQPRMSATVWYAADPDATAIRLIWYDRRNDPSNRLMQVYSAMSFELGATWQESVWTDTSFDVPAICSSSAQFDCAFPNCYMGDYLALANLYPENSLFIGAWGDNRGPVVSGTPVCNPAFTSSPDPNVRVSSVGC
jgi:hypothetical protein